MLSAVEVRRSRFAVSKKAECHAELVSASDSAFFVTCLAYAELKVNFVEGYLCCDVLSEVEVSAVEVRRSSFNGFAVSKFLVQQFKVQGPNRKSYFVNL